MLAWLEEELRNKELSINVGGLYSALGGGEKAKGKEKKGRRGRLNFRRQRSKRVT